MQLDLATRTAIVASIEATWGTDITIEFRTGAKPAALGDADAGTLLAVFDPGPDWASQANATLTFTGMPLVTDGLADGTAGYYRIKSTGAVVRSQGTISNMAGTGDMKVDNTSIVVDQETRILEWTIAAGNA